MIILKFNETFVPKNNEIQKTKVKKKKKKNYKEKGLRTVHSLEGTLAQDFIVLLPENKKKKWIKGEIKDWTEGETQSSQF